MLLSQGGMKTINCRLGCIHCDRPTIELAANAVIVKGHVVHHNLRISPAAIDFVDHLIATVFETDFLALKVDVEIYTWDIFKNIILRNASRLVDVLICEQRLPVVSSPEVAVNSHFAIAFQLMKAANPSINIMRWENS